MVDIEALQKMRDSGLIRLAALARQANMTPNTLQVKVKRGTELRVTEARKIHRVLQKQVCELIREPEEREG